MRIKIPISFDDAGELVDSPDLPHLLTQRLIQLAFSSGDTVAYRAIELLIARPRAKDVDEMDSMSALELFDIMRDAVVGDDD